MGIDKIKFNKKSINLHGLARGMYIRSITNYDDFVQPEIYNKRQFHAIMANRPRYIWTDEINDILAKNDECGWNISQTDKKKISDIINENVNWDSFLRNGLFIHTSLFLRADKAQRYIDALDNFNNMKFQKADITTGELQEMDNYLIDFFDGGTTVKACAAGIFTNNLKNGIYKAPIMKGEK